MVKAGRPSADTGAVVMTEGEDCNWGFFYGPVEDESISYCIVIITSKTRTVINQESDNFLVLALL